MKPTAKKEENKIDLAAVNKNKKQIKLPQIKNPLTKQKGPKRDDVGKFATTTGGGGLSSLKSFNFKRALPLLAIITIVGGFFVYKSFAATPNYGVAVTAWYRACGYSNPPTRGSNWQSWVDKLKANVAAQGQIYKQFKTAAELTGKTCPSSNPHSLAVPPPPSRPPSSPINNPPSTTAPTDYLKSINQLVTDSKSMATTSKSDNDKTYALSKKSNVTKAELDEIGRLRSGVKARVERVRGYKGQAQAKRNQANSNANSRNQVSAIDIAIGEIQTQLSKINVHHGNIDLDYKRASDTLYYKNKVAELPYFATPSAKCNSGYAQRGTIRVKYRPNNSTSWKDSVNAQAITCNKNKKRGTTPRWDIAKVGSVCRSPYERIRINKSIAGTGYNQSPPDGYVCFRAGASNVY